MVSLDRRRCLGALLATLACSALVGAAFLRSRARSTPGVPVASGPRLRGGDVPPAVALGSRSGSLLTPDGRLWMWGQYRWTAVPTGTTSPEVIEIAPDRRWRRVAAGSHHFLMIGEDGTLWGLGANFYGQLGFPPGNDSNLVRLSAETDWTDIAAGNRHSLGLRSDGSLWAWGGDDAGQTGLGLDSTNLVVAMRRVSPTHRWRTVATGHLTTAALHEDGTLWAWGHLDGVRRAVPERVDDRTDWIALGGGAGGALVALRADMPHTHLTAFSAAFQNGRPNSLFRPIDSLSGERWQPPVAAGESGFVARRLDGSWWAVGSNPFGRFGCGDRSDHPSPVRLPWPRETLAFGIESRSTYAFLADGTLWRAGVELGTPDPTPDTVGFARKLVIYGQALFDMMRGRNPRPPQPPSTTVPVKVWTWPGPGTNAPAHTDGPP